MRELHCNNRYSFLVVANLYRTVQIVLRGTDLSFARSQAPNNWDR